MKLTKRPLVRLCIVAVAFLSLIGVGGMMTGQEAPTQQRMGLVDDWTHHHLVFSNPGTAAEALKNGTVERWHKVTSDPRYQLQQLKRSLTQRAVAAAPDFVARAAIVNAASENAEAVSRKTAPTPKEPIKKDWSTNLGTGTTATLTATIVNPVTTSNVSGSSSLTIDGVTFYASPPTAASASGTFSSMSNSGTTLTIKNGSNTLTLTAGSTNGTCSGSSPWSVGFNRGSSGTPSTYSSGIITVLGSGTTCSTDIGLTASGTSPALTLTANTAGTGANSITLTWSSGSNFSEAWSNTTLGSGSRGTTAGTDGTTSGTTNPPTFAYWSVNNCDASSTLATNIATAVNENSTVSAVLKATANSPSSGSVLFTAKTAGAGGNSLTVTASSFPAFSGGTLSGGTTATVQPNTYPAKYGASLTSANCSDFAVYPTGQAGASGAANIIAYDNLYAAGAGAPCSGGPSVSWAYNTGAGQAVTTSPVLSLDGSQVAFIESNGTTASLVLVKWAAGTGESISSPLTLTNQSSGSAYHSCSPTAATPCMYAMAFANANNDTLSSPFYDYGGDNLYVGDDSGNLHQFTGVFNGSPAENTTSPWPVNLGTAKLSSPVYDPASGHVFAGDMAGTLHSVTASSGAIYGTASGLGDAIADAPLLDGSAAYLYSFVTTSGNISETGDNAIYGYSTYFTSNANPGVVAVGTGGAGYYLYAGSLDNVYYQSSDHTGNLYVVGNTGATTGATLYKVGVTGGVLSSVVTSAATGLTASGAHPWPSPLSEFCNGTCTVTSGVTNGDDYVFFSVNRGAVGGCATSAGNGCVLSYNVSNPSSVSISGSGLDVSTPGTNGCWATGGLVIDNSAGTTGASQIYFVNLDGAAAGGPTAATSSNCTAGAALTIDAVQAAQSSP